MGFFSISKEAGGETGGVSVEKSAEGPFESLKMFLEAKTSELDKAIDELPSDLREIIEAVRDRQIIGAEKYF